MVASCLIESKVEQIYLVKYFVKPNVYLVFDFLFIYSIEIRIVFYLLKLTIFASL